MGTPVSVVIPTYNRARLVGRAITSALEQVEPGDEIVVIDDGSRDDTHSVVGRFSGPVRLVAGAHRGAGAARNLGIEVARNPLIAFLDSDDEWLPGKLPLQRALMDAHPEIAYCFGDFRVRDAEGRVHPRFLQQWHDDPRPWDEILGPGAAYSTLAGKRPATGDFHVHTGSLYADLMERPYVATFTALFRRDLPGGVPRFPEDLPTFEDWEFFGLLARRGNGAYLDRETAVQHGHDGPRLTRAPELTQAEARLTVLARVWGADRDFQLREGSRYAKLVTSLERRRDLARAKSLLRAGRRREARAAFAALGGCPRKLRPLLLLPGPALRGLARADRLVRELRP